MERTWYKMFGQNGVLNFIRQLDHPIHLLLRLLPLLHQLLEVLVDGVLAPEKRVHLMFLQREPGFDGLFASPVFSVRLALDKDLHGHVR